MRPISSIIAVLAGLATSGSAAASGPGGAAGLEKAAICASCHGPVGISPVPTYRNIAGQNALCLEHALKRYRAGERGGDQFGMMFTVTQALSDTDITDLADYDASLPAGR
ncbi:cytochrome c553 [Tepidamorphus gemmatus]|uniref:Cytochrome c553 n=1 Tax=Tepidamorphus gemmatus TaxID=747076 RepID=A0A4R3M7V4_9HYPH|nr:c-type cytochrome [Tepidamorphus gemmatus]TCT09162.1 cytochrome c553 [Tepidamorphus gemmatus]